MKEDTVNSGIYFGDFNKNFGYENDIVDYMIRRRGGTGCYREMTAHALSAMICSIGMIEGELV